MTRFLYLIPFFVLLALGCEREVMMDAAGDEVVAVECVLTTDDVQHLSLTYTRGRSDGGAYREVDEAVALLYDLTEDREAGRFVHAGSGWELVYSAVPGHEYSLEVTVPGGNVISAVTAMPEKKEICFAHIISYSDYYYFPYSKFMMFLKGTVLLRPELLVNDAWIYATDTVPNLSIIENITTTFKFVDFFNLKPETLKVADKYEFKAHDYYLRLEKGYLEPDKYLKELHDENYGDFNDGGYLEFAVFAAFSEETKASGHGTLVVMTVSDEYDRYLKDSMVALRDKDSGDLMSSYRRENVYSNIEGGTGIFGAKLEDPIEIFIPNDFVWNE